jgi:ribosomal protein S18 acetylase RimI-like enzyme
VAVDDTELTGALFVYPLQYDARFTPELSEVADKVHTPYIAELMVQEKYRGRGLGRRMLLKTLLHLRHNRFSNVFIRVWNKNLTALNLYTKSGFKKVGQILQMKWFPDRKSKMIMEKFYLSRGL